MQEKRNSIFHRETLAWNCQKIYEGQFLWLRLPEEIVFQGTVFQNIFLMANFLDENFPRGKFSRGGCPEGVGRWQFPRTDSSYFWLSGSFSWLVEILELGGKEEILEKFHKRNRDYNYGKENDAMWSFLENAVIFEFTLILEKTQAKLLVNKIEYVRVHRQKIFGFLNGIWPLRRGGCEDLANEN